MMNDFEMMYEEYKKMVNSLVNTYKEKYPKFEKEEMNQIAMIGFWKACEKFEEGKGAKFSTYAYLLVEGHIKNWIRKQTNMRRKNYVNLGEMYEVKMGKELSEEEVNRKYNLTPDQLNMIMLNNVGSVDEEGMQVGYSQSEFNDVEVKAAFNECGLNPKQIKLLNLRYDGYTMREIAEVMGMHYSAVSRNLKSITEKFEKAKNPTISGVSFELA